MRAALIGLLLPCLLSGAAAASCPIDPSAPASTWLTVQMPGAAPKRLSEADFAALPQVALSQRRTVTSADGDAKAAVDQGVRYDGVLLRELIARASPETIAQRSQRWLVFEAVATDGYRAYFTWGELFNSTAGDQVLVIARQEGRPLAQAEGPLALRAMGDLRPGPRHVRNFCGLTGRLP